MLAARPVQTALDCRSQLSSRERLQEDGGRAEASGNHGRHRMTLTNKEYRQVNALGGETFGQFESGNWLRFHARNNQIKRVPFD